MHCISFLKTQHALINACNFFREYPLRDVRDDYSKAENIVLRSKWYNKSVSGVLANPFSMTK